MAPDPYGGPVYGGFYGPPYYGSYYGGGYGYGAPAYLPVLPAGATCVYEHGEPHWYHHGTCYRRGPHGYVVVHNESSHHHSSQSSSRHSSHHGEDPHPTHSNRHVTGQKKPAPHSQPALSRENRYGSREDSRDDDRKSSSHHSHHSSDKDSGKSGGSGGRDQRGR